METIEVQGSSVPRLGFGTLRQKGPDAYSGVRHALELGYRHIDTAQRYDNEEEVGRALDDGDVAREDLFVVTKIAMDNMAAPDVRSSTEASLRKLRTEYVDLLMIHWPVKDVPLEETLEAMSSLVDGGSARHLGICNFPPGLLARAVELAPILAHQVEYHPYLAQDVLVEAAKRHGHLLVAYCPLARGQVVQDASLTEIGRDHGKSAAQVALRWLLQQSPVSTIPGSGDPGRRAENIDVFDFSLSDGEMERVFGLRRADGRLVNPPHAPDDWNA